MPRSYHSRSPDKSTVRRHSKNETSHLPPPKLSLLEELFPEETSANKTTHNGEDENVPRLALPEVDRFFEEFQDELDPYKQRPKKITARANTNAFKQKQLALLVLQIASKSLVESDFRRIAPKGKHIGDWTGPGDILKVIPGRDPKTLEQAEYYFILFPNPAYARTYQSHLVRLHRAARTYIPTSIEAPLPVRKGAIIEGEDVRAMLQDYALCPPSQRIQLRMVYPPYAAETRSVIQAGGYRQLVDGESKIGRSVLFWIDGHNLTTSMIKNTLAADGRDRGLAWEVWIDKVNTPHLPADEEQEEDFHDRDYDAGVDIGFARHAPTRWILSFSDEAEARRFRRTWHRQPFPVGKDGGKKLAHAEFLW